MTEYPLGLPYTETHPRESVLQLEVGRSPLPSVHVSNSVQFG